MTKLSDRQSQTHSRALELSRRHRQLEADLIEVLREIGRTKLYKKLGYSSLFIYVVKELKFSEAVAYYFISVARKVSTVPTLGVAIREGRLSVAKASRIVSVLNPENAARLIEFASQHSARETELEVAKISPRAVSRARVKPLTEDLVELKVCVPKETARLLERAQNILSSKAGVNIELDQVLSAALKEFVERHDPVAKAERAKSRVAQNSERSEFAVGGKSPATTMARSEIAEVGRRKPLTADQIHVVHRRDRGRCTHISERGERCANERWLQIHHIHPVSRGGGNHPDNLTTLCAFHHDLVHQLSLPIDGQVTWLRSPKRNYQIRG